MKKFIFLIFLYLLFCANANADICLLTDKTTAEKIVDILNNEHSFFEYCSTCKEAIVHPLNVKDVTTHPADDINYKIYVNSNPVDAGHIYLKKDNKYHNLAVIAGCKDAIKSGIEAELVELKERHKISYEDAYKYAKEKTEKIFNRCHDKFFKKQEYDFAYAINVANSTNQCIEDEIKNKIDALFSAEQKTKALKYFEEISNSSGVLYEMLYNRNIYCEDRFCGLDAELMAISDKTTLLRQILENLIFIEERGE